MTASAIVSAASAAGLTIATAESMTGGAVAAALARVPGASRVLRGGVVAYAPDLKRSLLGVDDADVDRAVVSETVAAQMAAGARRACGADLAVSITGAAGPESHGGVPAGTVCVGVASAHAASAATLQLPGGRDEVISRAVEAALRALADAISQVTI